MIHGKTTEINRRELGVFSFIGQRSDEVESILGKPSMVTANDDNDDILAGREYWDYYIGKYWIMVVKDKVITLDNQTPVRYQLMPSEGVFLAFDEQACIEECVSSRSLNGEVYGNHLDGSSHQSEDRSSVEGGKGIEASSVIVVTFT